LGGQQTLIFKRLRTIHSIDELSWRKVKSAFTKSNHPALFNNFTSLTMNKIGRRNISICPAAVTRIMVIFVFGN
jgi:hypothetical protein